MNEKNQKPVLRRIEATAELRATATHLMKLGISRLDFDHLQDVASLIEEGDDSTAFRRLDQMEHAIVKRIPKSVWRFLREHMRGRDDDTAALTNLRDGVDGVKFVSTRLLVYDEADWRDIKPTLEAVVASIHRDEAIPVQQLGRNKYKLVTHRGIIRLSVYKAAGVRKVPIVIR